VSKRESLCSQGADSQTDNAQVKRLERSFGILVNEGEKQCCDTNAGRGIPPHQAVRKGPLEDIAWALG